MLILIGKKSPYPLKEKIVNRLNLFILPFSVMTKKIDSGDYLDFTAHKIKFNKS